MGHSKNVEKPFGRTLPFGNELESNDLSRSLLSPFVHFTEGTLSDRMQDVILVHFQIQIGYVLIL